MYKALAETSCQFINTLEDLAALNEKLNNMTEFAVDLEVRIIIPLCVLRRFCPAAIARILFQSENHLWHQVASCLFKGKQNNVHMVLYIDSNSFFVVVVFSPASTAKSSDWPAITVCYVLMKGKLYTIFHHNIFSLNLVCSSLPLTAPFLQKFFGNHMLDADLHQRGRFHHRHPRAAERDVPSE